MYYQNRLALLKFLSFLQNRPNYFDDSWKNNQQILLALQVIDTNEKKNKVNEYKQTRRITSQKTLNISLFVSR